MSDDNPNVEGTTMSESWDPPVGRLFIRALCDMERTPLSLKLVYADEPRGASGLRCRNLARRRIYAANDDVAKWDVFGCLDSLKPGRESRHPEMDMIFLRYLASDDDLRAILVHWEAPPGLDEWVAKVCTESKLAADERNRVARLYAELLASRTR